MQLSDYTLEALQRLVLSQERSFLCELFERAEPLERRRRTITNALVVGNALVPKDVVIAIPAARECVEFCCPQAEDSFSVSLAQ